MFVAGGCSCTAADDDPLLAAFFTAWCAVGLLSLIIGSIQVFAPSLADGLVIARSSHPGRAVGNLRQPNHLSTLLSWSAVAVVPLLEAGTLRRRLGALLFALSVFGIALTGSRTGGVGIVLLALWGMLDRRLSGAARGLLLASPLVYGLSALGMWAWAEHSREAIGAATRLSEAGFTSSRLDIWRNTLALIARHPWTGVGWGEFNFAWSLTPFPDRPTAFFDHTHNLPLQLLVELGVPLGLLVLGLLAAALWQAYRRSTAAAGTQGVRLRAAFVMLLLVGLHSMLEYPLWYAYFLLPAAFAWGACLGAGAATTAAPSGREGRRRLGTVGLRAAGVAMALAGIVTAADYHGVTQIFAPGPSAGPLPERIAAGQRSLLFAHHADYAAVTTPDSPVTTPGAFDRAPHYLLDTRLMIAWARSLAARGDLERARHVAQRLREFGRPESAAFFAACQEARPRPFQCTPPSGVPDWREFRRPPAR